MHSSRLKAETTLHVAMRKLRQVARTPLSALLTALIVTSLAPLANAQSFPNRPIRLIVPYSAGGPADVLGRQVAKSMSDVLGQPVVVDNRAGANTIIGMDLTARAPADGHTLIMATTAMPINAASGEKLPYDSLKDFTPISNLVSASLLMVVHPAIPARDLKEFITYAKSKPGQLAFGSGGTGSPTHLSGELLKSMAGIDMLHVPYKGIAPALTDLLAGTIPVLFADPLVMLPHVRRGGVRALGVTSLQRYAAATDIPTIAEAGLPGYESTLWYGILAPAGVPRPIVERLNRAIVQALAAPDLKAPLAAMGTTVIGDSAAHFSDFIVAEHAKWAKASASLKQPAQK